MNNFSWPVRVYYEDTDHGGVIYHANYLKFMERARTEWLREKGFEQDVLADQFGMIITVASVQIDFLRPGRFNQLLAVTVRPAGVRRASVMVEQDVCLMTDNGERGEVLSRAHIKIACVDAVRLRPRPFPEQVRREILGDC